MVGDYHQVMQNSLRWIALSVSILPFLFALLIAALSSLWPRLQDHLL